MDTGRRNGLVAVAIVAVIAVVIGIGYAVQSGRDTSGDRADAPGTGSAQSTPSDSSTADPGKLRAEAAETYGLGIGDPKAPVKVEIYEDFLCPFCGQFEAGSREMLHQAAQDGSAYVVYRPMAFLNEYSGRAMNAFGVVLDAAGGPAALAMHDQLFAQQPSEGGAMPDDDWLVERAVEAGADEDAVRKGIEEGSFGQWVVNGTDAASKAGVTSTPTVLVDGERVEAGSIEELVATVQDRIEQGS